MDALQWESRPGPLRDPVMVAAFTGWNDAASAASSALAFVGQQLEATRVARIEADDFYDYQATRPQVDLSEPGAHTLTWPDVEVAVGRPADAARDLVLVSGAEPSMRWRGFCDTVLGLAAEVGAGTVVTMGALLADVPHTRPVRLTGMATDRELLGGMGMREPAYKGPTGIVGVLHHEAARRGLGAVSLWAPASHYAAGITNTKAALALVRGLETVTGLSFRATALEGPALAFERQVSRAVDADPRLRGLVEQLEQAADAEGPFEPGPLPSGDDLARELERFLREQGGEQ